jgi:hypothetical protein
MRSFLSFLSLIQLSQGLIFVIDAIGQGNVQPYEQPEETCIRYELQDYISILEIETDEFIPKQKLNVRITDHMGNLLRTKEVSLSV